MTAPKTKYPIASFGPELMALLIKGSQEKVVLTFEGEHGRRKAKHLQLRIQTLRARMREERHPDYRITMRAKVSVMWGERAVKENAPVDWKEDEMGYRGALLVVRPHDSEFSDAIAKAGVNVPPPTFTPPSSKRTNTGDFLDEILAGVDTTDDPSENNL